MVAELSPFMSELEIDRAVDLLNTMSSSQWDINLTTDDAAYQMKILLGSERYEIVKSRWAQKNQHLIKDGRTKFIHISTGNIFDGLDAEDNPAEYKRITM
jgi:hypothetical protein